MSDNQTKGTPTSQLPEFNPTSSNPSPTREEPFIPVAVASAPPVKPTAPLTSSSSPDSRPTYLNYDGNLRSRSLLRFFPLVFLLFAIFFGIYYYLNLRATKASINLVEEEGSETPVSIIFDPTSCPLAQYLECRGDKKSLPECDREYVSWAKSHCPGFVGAAY